MTVENLVGLVPAQFGRQVLPIVSAQLTAASFSEIAVVLLAGLCYGSSDEAVVQLAFAVLPRALVDPSPRVRLAAAFDLGTALVDNEQAQPHLIALVPTFLALLSDRECERVAIGVCDFLKAWAAETPIPKFDLIISRYFELVEIANDRLSGKLADAICFVIKHAKNAELVRQSTRNVINLITQTFVNPALRRHSRDIVDVFCAFCNTPSGREFHVSIGSILPALISAFQDPDVDSAMILAISCIAKIASGVDAQSFEPFLQTVMELAIGLILRDDPESFTDACEALRDLLPLYDVTPFLSTFVPAIADAIERHPTQMRFATQAVRVFTALLQSPAHTAAGLEAAPRLWPLAAAQSVIAVDPELSEALLDFFNSVICILSEIDSQKAREWLEFGYTVVIASTPHLDKADDCLEVPDYLTIAFCRLADLSGDLMREFLSDDRGQSIVQVLLGRSKWHSELRVSLLTLGVDVDCLE
jgi:hypothetical protein